MDAPGMSLKQELEIWASALKAYEAQEFLAALELFSVQSFPCLLSTP
jgi:hypothetical protein